MDIVIKGQRDYHKLFHLIMNPLDTECVNIHLYQTFLRPMDTLILTEFIIYHLNTVGKVNLNVQNQPVKNYLEAIGLLEFCSENYSSPSEILEIPSYTAMPIRRVKRSTMNNYIFENQAFFQILCPGKDLGVLQIALSELINNVYDHAKSPIDCYVFCQYYSVKRSIVIAVADLGFGIPLIVNEFMQAQGAIKLSQFDAVRWSLELHKTTRSEPHNAGRGLDTIASFVQAINGSWMLFSDEVKMEGSCNGNMFSPNPIQNFIGTVIEISIRVDNLNDIEIVDSLDWQ